MKTELRITTTNWLTNERNVETIYTKCTKSRLDDLIERIANAEPNSSILFQWEEGEHKNFISQPPLNEEEIENFNEHSEYVNNV